jgi:hypothetical protein
LTIDSNGFSCFCQSLFGITDQFPNIWKLIAREKALNNAKRIKMIEDETPHAEIMKKMGFKTSTQIKNAYMKALIVEGKDPAINDIRKHQSNYRLAKRLRDLGHDISRDPNRSRTSSSYALCRHPLDNSRRYFHRILKMAWKITAEGK